MTAHYLGIDLGSSYTKFAVTDDSGKMVYKDLIPTLSRDKTVFQKKIEKIQKLYAISRLCTTGYGRFSLEGDLNKTELICASQGATTIYPEHKCIIDIGGEDIKIVESAQGGEIINFYMNDKCSAGTGTFITEIAEKAELKIEEMSSLAKTARGTKIINSFCTVFAKTEILGWKFAGVPIEEIARGIYLSIVSRINKLPVRRNLPIILCGGVIAYHSYLGELLSEEFGAKVKIAPDSQYLVALGAAIWAGK